jgi:hypothetical protein
MSPLARDSEAKGMKTGVPDGLMIASVCETRSECYNSTVEVHPGGSRLGFNLAMTGKEAQ